MDEIADPIGDSHNFKVRERSVIPCHGQSIFADGFSFPGPEASLQLYVFAILDVRLDGEITAVRVALGFILQLSACGSDFTAMATCSRKLV